MCFLLANFHAMGKNAAAAASSGSGIVRTLKREISQASDADSRMDDLTDIEPIVEEEPNVKPPDEMIVEESAKPGDLSVM